VPAQAPAATREEAKATGRSEERRGSNGA